MKLGTGAMRRCALRACLFAGRLPAGREAQCFFFHRVVHPASSSLSLLTHSLVSFVSACPCFCHCVILSSLPVRRARSSDLSGEPRRVSGFAGATAGVAAGRHPATTRRCHSDHHGQGGGTGGTQKRRAAGKRSIPRADRRPLRTDSDAQTEQRIDVAISFSALLPYISHMHH